MTNWGKMFLALVLTLEVVGLALIGAELVILAHDANTELHWIALFGAAMMATGAGLYAKGFKFFSRI